jgi:hypothetical protein
MAVIKSFDKTNLTAVRAEIDKALATVGTKLGIALKIGNISYSGDTFHTKLEAFVVTKDASGKSPTEVKMLQELKKYGFMFGVDESHLGKTFSSNGETFKFAGVKPSRPKYPVVGTSVRTGKSFKFREGVLTQITKRK